MADGDETQILYDPTWDQATCTANGYYWCPIQLKCLNQSIANGTHNAALAENYPSPGDTGVPENPGYECGDNCPDPIFNWEVMEPLTEFQRIKYMRDIYYLRYYCYAANAGCPITEDMTPENKRIILEELASTGQILTTLNNQLVDLTDGVPTSPEELMSTHLGAARDKVSDSTRRTYPWGTLICEMDGYKAPCALECTPPEEDYLDKVPDDTPDPNFDHIKYEPSHITPPPDFKPIDRKFLDYTKWENKDKYSKKHESCLTELPCTFEDLEDPEINLEDVDLNNDPIDVGISDEDITTGCANGDGLYDKLMTAIDSSIDLQYKNSRLDAKSFGEFYASAMSAAMQTTTQFLIQKEQLKLDAERISIERDKLDLDKDKHKYDVALTKAQTTKVLLEIEHFKKESPLRLAKLTQEVKLTEKQVEATARQIEETEAQTVSIYNNIAETHAINKLERARIKATTEKILKDIDEITLNGEKDRNLKEVQIEQGRVNIKATKFEAILKKYQAYSTKVNTEETKLNGASQRRIYAADVQSKNRQAALYDQQRKTYVYGQRADILKILRDIWATQIDTLGAENMVVEVVKGPEFAAKLERASLDAGL